MLEKSRAVPFPVTWYWINAQKMAMAEESSRTCPTEDLERHFLDAGAVRPQKSSADFGGSDFSVPEWGEPPMISSIFPGVGAPLAGAHLFVA